MCGPALANAMFAARFGGQKDYRQISPETQASLDMAAKGAQNSSNFSKIYGGSSPVSPMAPVSGGGSVGDSGSKVVNMVTGSAPVGPMFTGNNTVKISDAFRSAVSMAPGGGRIVS